MSERPDLFFIVGAARSGTTLLRIVLSHHSRICECHEMNYVCEYYANHGPGANVAAYHRYLDGHLGFRMSGYTYDETLGYLDQIHSFIDQRRALDGAPLVGAVVHHAAGVLPEIWPNAKFVHMQRDPRDVARSSVQMGWAGIPWRGADFWLAAEREWNKIERQVPADRRFGMRFEDFTAESEKSLEELCAFLGVSFEPGMLDIETTTTYKRPSPQGAASWKTAHEDEIRQIEAAVGEDRIRAAGYDPSGLPPLNPNAWTTFQLRLANIVKLQQDKVKRYGFRLTLGLFLSRRLPFEGFRTAVLRRIDNVTVKNMK